LTKSDSGPLGDLKVVDCATLFAGPLVGTILGDFGADVLKVEQPEGEGLRSMGMTPDGLSLWWAFVSRNKRCVSLRLSNSRGAEILRELVRDADVLIENFRPGTLERWGLAPQTLHEINPRLVILRMTGFGQTGPYRSVPGYGTLAEAMSGFAQVNGWPEGPPTLPPFALADSVAALTATSAVMFALWWRDHAPNGRGQVVDQAIYESMFWIMGPAASLYDRLGTIPERTGNQVPHTAPRNVYRTCDEKWVALSASTPNVARRVMTIIGRDDILGQDWYASHDGRVAHATEIDGAVASWIGSKSLAEVRAAFAEGHAAIAPVMTIEDIVSDPHYIARETIVRVDDPRYGPLLMQNVISRLTETPGSIRHLGPMVGQHNDEVYREVLSATEEDLRQLREEGVI
jgi:crotonobetainyl-CoA:carnitine CoA-transferase CaiB-like acyl-CoA transferase